MPRRTDHGARPAQENQLLPKTKYARSDDVLIAYQLTGESPVDVVMAPGTMSRVCIVRARGVLSICWPL